MAKTKRISGELLARAQPGSEGLLRQMALQSRSRGALGQDLAEAEPDTKDRQRQRSLDADMARINEKYSQPGAHVVNVGQLRDKYDHRPGHPAATRQRDSDGYLVARVNPPDPLDRSVDVEAHLLQRRSQDLAAQAEAERARLVQESMAKRRAEPPPAKVGTSIRVAMHRGDQRRASQAAAPQTRSLSLSAPAVTVQPEASLPSIEGEAMVPEGYVPLVSDDPGTEMWSRGLAQNHVIVKMGGKYYAVPKQQKSDERSKQAIETVRSAPGYSYEYKQGEQGPGAPPGRHIGPMAQDLEKTPMGAEAVSQAPDGTKQVDMTRLPLINTAALHDVDQRLRKLEGKR